MNLQEIIYNRYNQQDLPFKIYSYFLHLKYGGFHLGKLVPSCKSVWRFSFKLKPPGLAIYAGRIFLVIDGED